MATTATTKARTKEDVDQMSAQGRVWDSLNYSYGQKRDSSNQEFAKAYSQADRQLLGRGMQRSSYGAQTLANIDKQRIDASNDIWNQQIADYENRLYQIERDEKADQQWQAQFDEGQRQFNENLGFQKERAAVQDTQWQQNFDEGVRQYNTTMDYNKERAAVQDTQWQKQFDEGVRQFNTSQSYTEKSADQSLAYNWVMAALQNGQVPSDDLLARAGISRADAEKLIAQVQAGAVPASGGRYSPGPSTNDPSNIDQVQDAFSNWWSGMDNYGNNGTTLTVNKVQGREEPSAYWEYMGKNKNQTK